MLEDFVGRISLKRIDLEHPRDQLLGRVGDVVPVRRVELEQTAQNLIEKLFLLIRARRERRISHKQDVHDDPGGPDVNLDPVTRFREDLRGDVGRRAADGEEGFGDELRQTEVAKFERLEAFANVVFVVLVRAEVNHLQEVEVEVRFCSWTSDMTNADNFDPRKRNWW